MANEDLTLSDRGKNDVDDFEGGLVDGLFNDSSKICTFGAGHLVHPGLPTAHQHPCYLLAAASDNKDLNTKYVRRDRIPLRNKKRANQKPKVTYLQRSAAQDTKHLKELKEKAVDIAKTSIALKDYKKPFDKLSKENQQKVEARAKTAVDEEAQMLGQIPNAVFEQDIKKKEKIVRDNITVKLTPEEFDALVIFCFNIEKALKGNSSVV